MPDIPDIVDRSYNEVLDMPKRLRLSTELNTQGIETVCKNLSSFHSKSFGHLSYLPEYAEALQAIPAKVLFNIRDPRDIVISEYENGLRHLRENRKGKPLWDFLDKDDNKFTFEKDDVIAELIIYASCRWKRWIGWLDHDFVYPVKYEDLRLNPTETISNMCTWLAPFECDPVGHMIIRAQPKPGNPTFRKGVPGEWKERFTKQHIKLSELLLSPIIKRLGYG